MVHLRAFFPFIVLVFLAWATFKQALRKNVHAMSKPIALVVSAFYIKCIRIRVVYYTNIGFEECNKIRGASRKCVLFTVYFPGGNGMDKQRNMLFYKGLL